MSDDSERMSEDINIDNERLIIIVREIVESAIRSGSLTTMCGRHTVFDVLHDLSRRVNVLEDDLKGSVNALNGALQDIVEDAVTKAIMPELERVKIKGEQHDAMLEELEERLRVMERKSPMLM